MNGGIQTIAVYPSSEKVSDRFAEDCGSTSFASLTVQVNVASVFSKYLR